MAVLRPAAPCSPPTLGTPTDVTDTSARVTATYPTGTPPPNGWSRFEYTLCSGDPQKCAATPVECATSPCTLAMSANTAYTVKVVAVGASGVRSQPAETDVTTLYG